MTPPFLRLPLEVMAKVNRYLAPQDRYQFCLVNRVLYENFKDLLFTSISLCYNYQVNLVFRLMLLKPHLFRKTDRLDVSCYFEDKHSFRNVLQCCPNITMLKIGGPLWSFLCCQLARDFNDYPMLPKLIELNVVDYDHSYWIPDLVAFFSKCPNLEILKLCKLRWVVSPSQVESLHGVLPRLQGLYLDYIPTPSGNFYVFPTNPIPDAPCVFMKKIRFAVSGNWNNFIPWMRYVARKYPNLEDLDITGKQDYISWNIRLEEVESALRLLLESCKNLSSIRLVNIWWTDVFLRHYQDTIHHSSSSIKKLEIVNSPRRVSTELFGLLPCSYTPFMEVLDVTLCKQIINNPVLPDDLRSGRMLTDLRISMSHVGSNSSNPFSIHWILESCPSLLSLTLDNGFLDVVNDTLTGLAPSTTQSHHLKRLGITNGTFKNEIWSYIEKKCPRLNWLSIDKSLLDDDSPYPSIQLKFPNHVFKSIIINHVRTRRAPTGVRSSPSFGSPIYNKTIWNKGWLPIEFMTIQRQQHPTLFTDNDVMLSSQNSTIRQTFQALDMDFIDQRHECIDDSVTSDLFQYFERLLEAKRLTAQGVLYYQRECGAPIPDPLLSDNPTTSSIRKRKKFNRQKERVRQKWKRHHRRARMAFQQQRHHHHHQHVTDTDRGGHILIDVHGVTDLKINQKWIIMQGK